MLFEPCEEQKTLGEMVYKDCDKAKLLCVTSCALGCISFMACYISYLPCCLAYYFCCESFIRYFKNLNACVKVLTLFFGFSTSIF